MFKYRDKQQLVTIYIYSMIAASIPYWSICSSLSRCEKIAKQMFKHFLQLFTCIFWHLRPQHSVYHQHHCLANSRTFQDLALRFFRTFQDQTHFPGLSRFWKFYKKNPGLSRRRGNHAYEIVDVSCSKNCDWSAYVTLWSLVLFCGTVCQRTYTASPFLCRLLLGD